MTTQTESLKLALEALEYDTYPEPKYGIQTAINILKEALAQPEQGPVACDCNQGQVCHICDPISEIKPEQPMDEAQVLRSLLGAALGALRYHTEQTRPIQRTKETIAAIEHELAAHSITKDQK